VLRQTGKPAEALAAFERAIAIVQKLADADPNVASWQNKLALDLCFVGSLRQKAGRTSEGVASFRKAVAIWERLPTLAPHALFNLACAHASLAGIATDPGSGMTASEGRAEAVRAMHWLRNAVAAGYRKLDLMRTDPDLDPLRGRDDFRLLLMDLTFPADPFARER
jgi:hypothetical protein